MTSRARVADRHPGGEDRNRDLKLIHIARKQLGMAEDAYRAIVRGISNQRTDSSGALTQAERRQLLKHLKACGFRPVQPMPANVFPDDPQWRLIWSLWQQLADAGRVNDRRGGALAAFVKAQTGVDAMAWLDGRQQYQVIEQLKNWLGRDDAKQAAARRERAQGRVE